MATESPIRISEAGGRWPSLKEAATFGSQSRNMETEDLGIRLKGHRVHGGGKDVIPNRSGSAPPSMEGSYLAIESLLSQHNSTHTVLLSRGLQNCESEEQLRADPAYLAYYGSNVNLNPRLPPPLISWENHHLVHHIGRFSNDWGLSSADDSSKIPLHLPRGTLATHKEEPEDDQSPQQPYDNKSDKTSGICCRQDAASQASQPKHVVDLIQEDFPRTPSPVYNKPLSVSHGMVEEAIDLNAVSSSSHESPVTTLETIDADDIRLSSSADTSSIIANSSSLEATSSVGYHDLDPTTVESQLKALNVSNLCNPENQKYEEKCQNNMIPHQIHQQLNNPHEVPSTNSQGVNCPYVEQFPHNPNKFCSNVQPLLQSSGFTPPLYATAAFMASANPFYNNLQVSGIYSPQYGGGYTFNPAAIPPYIAAYPPHGTVPVVDGASCSNFTAQTPGISVGGSISHGAEMAHTNKFLGQVGFPQQFSFGDPIYMQYHQQFGEGYTFSGHFNPLAPRASADSQIGPFDSQKRSNSVAYSDDKKFQHQKSGANMNPRRGGLMIPNYFGHPPDVGFVMQYPSSPLPSPALSGCPEGPNLPRGRTEMKISPPSGRNGGPLSGWEGQRGFNSAHDPKIVNFLEDLKSGKGRRFELSDIIGHIVEFSADQHGSRFIQQKLETCGVEEKALVFKEVVPHASKLMTDVFGNYVIQKFFEYGSPEQRKELANRLTGQILPLSLQMYGCRVIQKALEVIDLEQKVLLVHELDGNVIKCVRDQNGNHVIQKCIECIPTRNIGFILFAFRGQVANLSMHPYGCRVIQRVLEHCTAEVQCQFIVDEILESACALAQDQYGNYVTQGFGFKPPDTKNRSVSPAVAVKLQDLLQSHQHVLERGKPQERSQIIRKLSGHIVKLSQHKFASNVVEKCLEYGDATERERLIAETVGHDEENDNLLIMVKDQFGNYVVQKIIEICSESQRALLLSRIKAHAHALKKYTYGKHIVARLERLFGEENQTPGS